MAGLDTRGLASGFAQGFGLMNQYQRGQRADERADRQLGMQERGLQMREQEFDAIQEARQMEQDKAFATSWLQRAAAASEMQNQDAFPAWDEQAQEVFSRVPMMSPAHLFKNETVEATRYAERLQQGEGRMFSDDTARHMNNFFQPRIDRMPGRRSRIAGVYPGRQEGTLTFELGVTPTGGLEGEEQQEYMAPMTKNRGVAGEDDEVMQPPLDDVIRPVLGARKIYEAFGENLPYVQKIGVMQGWLPKPAESYETVQGPGGSLLQRNTATGELSSVVGRAPRASSNYWNRPTATQKDIEYLVGNGLAPDRETAWQMLNRNNDSSREELKYYTGRLEDIESILSEPGAANSMSDEELAQLQNERQAIRERLPDLESQAFGRQAPGLSNPPPPDQQPAPKPSTPQQQPEKETGIRPGPAESNDIQDSAASILEKYL